MDSRLIHEHYVSFGVQYTGDESTGQIHPMGMTADDYVVIEAPDIKTANNIAHAIFDDKFAFVYDWDHFMGDGTFERWYSETECPALTIKWIQS